MISFKLIGNDELKLAVNKYLVDDMKGIVVCVHGMAEHSKRYDDFALFLNNNGYSVYTYDHRGHGESILNGEKLGFLGKDGFNKMVSDLDIIISYVKEMHPNTKVYILGHSMGSFVTQRYIQQFNKVNGVILSGSNYSTKSLRLGRMLSRLSCIFKGDRTDAKLMNQLSFGSYNNNFQPSRTPFDWLSRDTQMVDLYMNDPACGFFCSNRFYYDFVKGLHMITKKKEITKVNSLLPLYIMSGEKDPVGLNGQGVKRLYQTYSQYLQNVDMKLYHDCRHELLNETNKMEVYQDILKWLQMNEE